MNIFKIGDTNFGIGKIHFEIDNENNIISELTIKGDEQIYKHITDDENNKWAWTLYPPEVYFRGIPCQQNGLVNVTIDNEILSKCEISLYFMEHNDLYGNLVITDRNIEVQGEVDVCGTSYQLYISIER